MPYTFSPSARTDLVQIWRHLAAESSEAADRMIDSFYVRFRLLSRRPLLGESRPDLGAEIRQLTSGSYVIYYTPKPDGVRVLRVLHGSRDAPNILHD